MKPFMSLCMIVKNEEKVIDRCLSSVAHLVDEVIVVDTGSTDFTKKIVEKYTTNIYDFKWINDFSAARNYAASQATGEWILVLDADEYVDEENFKSFIQEIRNDNGIYDVYAPKILNFVGDFGEGLVQNSHDRIYMNNGEISYYRKIHEQFKTQNNKPLKTKQSSLLIFHSGYLKQTADEKKKNKRNKELLDKEMKSGAINAFDYFNFGNEYMSKGEYSKALESYIQAYKMKADFRLAWVSATVIQIIVCLINLKRYNAALDVINDSEQIYPTSPELLYLKGDIFFHRGQLDDAKRVLLELINNNELYDHIILRTDLKDQKPYLLLGEIFLYEGEYERAIYHFTSVLNINKYNGQSIQKVIYILNKFHAYEEIAKFLTEKELIDAKNLKYYIKSSFDIGNAKLALSILEHFHEQNNLLHKVGLLKRFCIDKEGDIEEFDDILKYPVMKELIQSNWLNIIDVILLIKNNEQNSNIAELIKKIGEIKEFSIFMKIFQNESLDEVIEENLLVQSVQILINYKQFSLCDKILSNIQNIEKSSIPKVAALLFANDFQAKAIQLYEKADWNHFVEQDFLNIITSLSQTNQIDHAMKIADYAKSIFNEDFRFYKLILENTLTGDERYNQTLQSAKQTFLNSFYLEKCY
ncbi:glycosyltransferase [Cytobacillus sp. Hm23]